MADLPCLQSVKLGSEVFKYVHSVVMEWMGWWVRFTDYTIHWTRKTGSFRRWRGGSKDDGWRTLQLQECLEKWRVGLGERINRYFLTGFLPRRGQQLLCHRFGDSGEYGFAGGLTSTSLNCHPQNPLWLLQLRDGLFPSVLEYRRVFRCCCARIGYPRVWWVPLIWLYVCSDQVMDCSMICCSFRIIQLGAVIMHIL